MREEDRTVHEWYRFVLAFPPHLVRAYIDEFQLGSSSQLLDPFCGTGTTVIEAKKLNVNAVGLEANPIAWFASKTKCTWTLSGNDLLRAVERVSTKASRMLASSNGPLRTLHADAEAVLIRNSISPLPLHKSLVLLEAIRSEPSHETKPYMLLALAASLKDDIGNLRFGPEVGVGKLKSDVNVVELWRGRVESIAADLEECQGAKRGRTRIVRCDARAIGDLRIQKPIDAVITSPPYPNEKDYTRATRLESVVLGFTNNRQDVRNLKNGLMRSNTKNVFKGDNDDSWVENNPRIQRLAERLEVERVELGKDSGFERLYHRVVRLYFGGMCRHLVSLKSKLNDGAMLAYVVGDQASYFGVKIHTGEIIASIAEELGYDHVRTDLFRTRKATATNDDLREEVVILRWRR
jgi:hypothetical protein